MTATPPRASHNVREVSEKGGWVTQKGERNVAMDCLVCGILEGGIGRLWKRIDKLTTELGLHQQVHLDQEDDEQEDAVMRALRMASEDGKTWD